MNLDLDPALDIIRHWEGYRATSYKDPVGIWTIGYGTIRYPNGKAVTKGQKCTHAQATAWLMDEVTKTCVPKIKKFVRVPIANNQACALVSFIYNVGAGAFEKSTLLKKLNAGKPEYEVADEFLKWVKGGGRVLPGLVARRKDERGLFLATEVADSFIEEV